jgi:hypothetical protein
LDSHSPPRKPRIKASGTTVKNRYRGISPPP